MFAAGAVLIVAVLHGTGDVHDETAPSMVVTPSEVPVSESSEEETTQAEQVKKEEVKKKYVPAINALNLAYYFPKGADDTEDRLNSYAGEVYKKLMKKDNEYLAGIFDTSGMSPRSLAGRLGVGASRVMGKYNPSDGSQNPDDPSTWYIPDFKNVNVSFYNSDGKRMNEYSNVKDIMSMASVYCYAHGSLNPKVFEQYCEELYGKSRNYSISIGKVYYCDGCINRSAKEEADGIKRIESTLEVLKAKLAEDGEFVDVGADETVNSGSGSTSGSGNASGSGSTSGSANTYDGGSTSGSANTYNGGSTSGSANTYDGGSTMGNGNAYDNGIAAGSGNAVGSGNVSYIDSAAESDASYVETLPQENIAETAADALMMVDSVADAAVNTEASETESLTGPGYHNQDVPPEPDVTGIFGPSVPETAAVFTESVVSDGVEIQDVSVDMAAESVMEQTTAAYVPPVQNASTAVNRTVSNYRSLGSSDVVNTILASYSREDLLRMDDSTLRGLIEEVYDDNDSRMSANSETNVKSRNYCPGHVDLYVKVTISGFEDEKGLKSIKLSSDPFADGDVAWTGWTDERTEAVNDLISRDWYKSYGFSISTIDPKNPLTEEEISKYLDELPDDVSSGRKKVIKFALESVGKVPYYYGGKASAKGYEANHFGSVIGQSDHRGRVLRGLDCSGWIQWVYWSALGDDLGGACSTSSLVGEGEKIKRADLQPGDIIIREGADSHVVMFLAWAGNGNMIAIHENGSANNVSVNEVTASYPYYRKLIN